jgi:uncharacterized protein
MMSRSAIYFGTVTHKRLRPITHVLRYRVFSLFVDVDALTDLDVTSKLFGYNRARPVSIRDRDHGPGDGTPIARHARMLAATAPGGEAIGRIMMLCYPRLFGYVFNPITVYYCFGRDDALAVTIYEVSNTFGERHTYVMPVVGSNAVQSCAKTFYVSPFNAVNGRYSFHAPPPADRLAVGVALKDEQGPILKAYVTGKRSAFDDRTLLRALVSLPLMTFKVIAGIHWEALRLRIKGLHLVKRPPPPPPYEIAGAGK